MRLPTIEEWEKSRAEVRKLQDALEAEITRLDHELRKTVADAARLRADNEALKAAIEDAVETLEANDMHIENPLYDRLRAVLEPPDAHRR